MAVSQYLLQVVLVREAGYRILFRIFRHYSYHPCHFYRDRDRLFCEQWITPDSVRSAYKFHVA